MQSTVVPGSGGEEVPASGGVASSRVSGMPATFDLAARPRPSLGMKLDRPKIHTPSAAINYGAGSKITKAAFHNVEPHLFHPE